MRLSSIPRSTLLLTALSCSTAFLFSVQKTSLTEFGRSSCAWPLSAKKKGGGGKKKQAKKKSGMDWAKTFSLKPFEAQSKRELAQSMISSFKQRTGKPLVEDIERASDPPKALWNAPRACVVVAEPPQPPEVRENAVAADDQSPANPQEQSTLVQYANVAALETLGLRPDEFERLLGNSDGCLSRTNGVRITLPTKIGKGTKKFQSGYSKKISKGEEGDITILDAQRWTIEQACIIDNQLSSKTVGMAYAWSEWMLNDDVICSPGGGRRAPCSSETPALSPAELREAVDAQAAAVRELKEGRGLGNKDAEVVEAVQELLRLKEELEDCEE